MPMNLTDYMPSGGTGPRASLPQPGGQGVTSMEAIHRLMMQRRMMRGAPGAPGLGAPDPMMGGTMGQPGMAGAGPSPWGMAGAGPMNLPEPPPDYTMYP
ncbi:MAG: hypothetical protein ACREMG_05070, partial [Gemmatimonadales bacterium]